MKSTTRLFGIALAASALMLQGCSLDGGENSQTINLSTCNLIIPDDPDAAVSVQSNCEYTIRYDFTNTTLTINSSDIDWQGTKAALGTNDIPFKWYNTGNTQTYTFSDGTGSFQGGSYRSEVTNVSGYTTNQVYFYLSPYDPYPIVAESIVPVFQFKAGDTTVKTFQANNFYGGKTTTKYQMGATENEFENDEPIYRVSFASDMKTANVVIYKVRFAEEMPVTLEAVVLKSLPVEFNHSGYRISAENVVPEMLDGTTFVPFEDRTFDSFEFETVNADLTKVKCTYTCAGIFHGSFEGMSVAEFLSAK